MDNQKDIKRQVQNKSSRGDLSLNLNFNVNDRYYYLILKKVEKLGVASYMLTDHIDDFEPIKTNIRTCALALIKDTYSPEYHSDKKDKKEKTISTLACIEHILSLFDIALVTRMISTGNHSVIKKEYLLLREAVLELAEAIENKIIFPEDLFVVANDQKNTTQAPNYRGENMSTNKDRIHKGHSKENVSYGNVLLGDRNSYVPNSKKGTNPRNKEERLNLILKLFNRDSEMGIKDIHNRFTDCSEKTIQRELSKMLIRGLIVRKGDKRWSRYSLASR